MREVGVDGLFASPGLQIPISSHCEKRLLDVELDLTNSVTTLEAVQWAICELQRMELQELYSVPSDHLDDGVADGFLGRSTTGKEDNPDSENGTEDPAVATRSGIGLTQNDTHADEPIKKRTEVDGSPRYPKQQHHHTENRSKVEVRNWRQLFKATGKRKSDEEDSGSEGGKRTKASESSSQTTKKEILFVEADHGEAGKRMAERISARLVVPECIFLTNLVSHCLLVSMDQVPPLSIQEALASFRLDGPGGGASVAEGSDGITKSGSKCSTSDHMGFDPNSFDQMGFDQNGLSQTGFDQKDSISNDWLWLHKWLVKTVLSDIGDDDSFASLDWLIAFMTAARQSLIKPILDDLASDLERRENQGSVSLASYIRRAGVLEYAALRDPERIFGSLRPLFPPTVFPAPGLGEDDDERRVQGLNELWHGWLGIMVLCPRLFGAFSRFWIPTLSVDEVQSWRIKSAPTSLSGICSPLVGTVTEEHESTRGWLHATVMRRLPELAPVAFDLVVLLSALDEASTDQGASEAVLGFGKYVLTSIYKELSRNMLPKVLGAGRDLAALSDVERVMEDSGTVGFMANLKQHSHVLWRRALESYSTSKCTCCEIPHKEEMQLESSGRTKAGLDAGSMCVDSSGEGGALKASYEVGLEIQKGCLYKDPLIRLCHLTLLCCPDEVVADLLANASLVQPSSAGSFSPQSLRKLVMVMRAMWIVSGQGRGTLILELWAQHMIDHAVTASDEQALQIILAMRQLLDCDFWLNYHVLLGSSSQYATAIPIVASEDACGHQGLSWKVVWKGLHKVLDVQWLQILHLMHREGAWDLRLAVLTVLQLLNPDGTTRPQAVADRLKAVLGLFFSWLEVYDGSEENVVVGQVRKTAPMLERKSTWQCALAKEHLKCIIIELASSSFPSFTLMINSLLDFSFEHSKQTFTASSPPSSTGQLSRADQSGIPARKAGNGSPSSFCMAPLSTGKLDRYGRLELVSGPASERGSGTGSLQMADLQFTEENCRIQSDGSSPLQPYEKVRVVGSSQRRQTVSQNGASISAASEHLDEDLIRSKVLDAELASLLHRTFHRAKARSVELLDEWPCHPANVLATHLADRLETPHEVSMTMEQYEEVLPKHISSLRHIFLTDCFSQNPLLMETVELIVSHGGSRAVLRCVEFVRVLLADSIARWHGAFRTRWPHRVSQTKVGEMEAWNRIQVSRLIQLVASANWLPQPLAASGEIVSVIDGADIADLLLLVWRCMHHAMAFGSKAWGESSSNLHPTSVPAEGQATSTAATAAGDEEAGKEGTYTEWESRFFAILRRNIAKVGSHFPQVYPIRKAL
ncbi:unnamed protein product [Calypogeia fissa]